MTPLDDLGPHVDPLVGKVVGERYRLVRRIGAGGMGSVYEGLHTVIGRKVAVKLLHPQLAADPDQVARFLNEARAAAAIGHPNIVEAIDMGRTSEGAPYLVLELLEGESVAARLSRAGPLSAAECVRLGTQAASALSAAHAKQIVHRDLKPDNLFLARLGDGSEQVKILDFGVCKLAQAAPGGGTRTGSVMGTPAYMAPEQLVDSSRVDARADVYALGAALYQALSGRLPFEADTLPKLVERISQEPPPPLSGLRPDLSPELCELVHLCLEKDPAKRFQTMDALRAALDGLGPQPTIAPGLAATLAPGSGSMGLAATLPTPPARSTAPAPAPTPTAPATPVVVVQTPVIQQRPPAMPLPPVAARPREKTAWADRSVRRKVLSVVAVLMGLYWAFPPVRGLVNRLTGAQPEPPGHHRRSGDPIRHKCAGAPTASCAAPNAAWCDGDGKQVACCAAGLVALEADRCGCPPAGADPAHPVSGCPTAAMPVQKVVDAAVKEKLQDQLEECEINEKVGTLTVLLTLSNHGHVEDASVASSTLPGDEARSCVLDVFRDEDLPAPPGGATTVSTEVVIHGG